MASTGMTDTTATTDVDGASTTATTAPSAAGGLFSFPNPVNDVAARTVATGVVAMAVAFIVTGWGWILIPLTYGFVARVLTGPTLSPLGRIATQVVAPRLPDHAKFVPGPPKRFAQGIGVVFTVAASVLFVAEAPTAARVVIAMLAGAAFLEAAFGFCLGCKIFALLMRAGIVSETICEECNDLSLRIPALRQAP
jgi:hypothetical protein